MTLHLSAFISMTPETDKGQTTMGIIRKFLGLGLAAFIGLSATGAKVDPAYCNQNDVIGDTPIMTNAEKWVSNLLGDGKYDPSTDEGRTELARDVIKAFGAEDTSVRGRLAFKLTGITPEKTVTVSGITANGNFTIDWGDGTREVIENPPLLAGAMPRASKSASHKFPPGMPEPVIDFPQGDIIDISGTGTTDSTREGFIHDENGDGLIKALNISEYDGPISWGMAAFARNANLEEVVIPTNVVSIGAACFASCSKLRKLTILANFSGGTSSMSTFRRCNKLGDVIIGGECRSIPNYAFNGCTALSNFTFRSDCKLSSIGTQCFSGCTSLKKLHLPEGIKSISIGYDNAIEDISIPDSVETLEHLQIANRNSLKTFKLPANIKELRDTFHSWTNLEYITLPRTIKTIGAGSFAFCYNLTNVNFEAGARLKLLVGNNTQEAGAFEDCWKLKNITIPLGDSKLYVSVHSGVFRGCKVLESVNFDCLFNKFLSFQSGIFENCPKLAKISMNTAYPPYASSSSIFGTIPEGCKIEIPYLSSTNYLKLAKWSEYAGRYQEKEPTNEKLSIVSTRHEQVKLGKTYCDDTFIVDWGDGNVDEYESGTSPTHTYSYYYDYYPQCNVIQIKNRINRIEGVEEKSYVAYWVGSPSYGNPYWESAGIAYATLNENEDNIKFGKGCFRDSKMSSVDIGRFVTSIGDNCFRNGTLLKDVNFSAHGLVDSIGQYSFSGCPLTRVSIPKSLFDIGAYSFYGCKNLTSVEYAKNGSIENIGDYAFTSQNSSGTSYECYLNDIKIPDTVKRIGNSAFEGCKHIAKIDLPQDGVLDEIGDKAFLNANAATGKIQIPESVRRIGAEAFRGAVGITEIDLPQNGRLDYIGDMAFYNNTSHLADITIPSTVKWIGNQAFDGLTYPPNITFAEGSRLEHIGYMGDTVELGAITLPESLKYFGGYYSWNVGGVPYIPEIPDGVEYLGCLGCNDRHEETSYVLPSSIKMMDKTFQMWSGLTEFTVPASVTNLTSAFYSCYGLESVTFEDGSNLKCIGGSTFASCRNLKSLVIPDGVVEIGSRAFESCDSIESITIPSSVTSIGYMAFEGCDVLTSVNIPSGVTMIPQRCFAYCYGLAEYTVNNGVKEVDDSAFYKCTSMTTLDLPASLEKVGYDLCDDCTALRRINVRATTPPQCTFTPGDYLKLFGDLPSSCYIYVPSASAYAYRNATGWSKYSSKIVGTSF